MLQRIQRRRAKGWRMPANALCVSRPGPWGNCFIVGRDGTVAECVHLFRCLLAGLICLTVKASVDEQLTLRHHVAHHADELLAYDYLACFCPLDRECHGDVLIEIAELLRAEKLEMWSVAGWPEAA
jgi:hypothetical protein